MKTILKLLGRCSQIVGGMHSNYWGDISSHPLRVLAPLLAMVKFQVYEVAKFRKCMYSE